MQAESWTDTVKKLSCIKRFSQTEMAKPENVLEHTGMVSLIALHIGLCLKEEGCDTISIAELMKRALLHDIEESHIGDVARPAKYATDRIRDSFKQLELKVSDSIFDNANCNSMKLPWASAKLTSTIEGSVVTYSDALSAALKFHDEIYIRNNLSMIPLMSADIFSNLNRLLYLITNHIEFESVVINSYSELNEKIESEISGR